MSAKIGQNQNSHSISIDTTQSSRAGSRMSANIEQNLNSHIILSIVGHR